MRGSDLSSRSRFTPDARRSQIRTVAEQQLLAIGCLPLSLERLAEGVGVSKALIYRYFDTQESLFNDVLSARLEEMLEQLKDVIAEPGAQTKLERGLETYFRHVARVGPIMRFILRDPFMRGKLTPQVKGQLAAISRPFELALAQVTGLDAPTAAVGLQLLVAIPEEAAILSRKGELKPTLASQLCRELIIAGIAGLKKKSATSRSSPKSR